MSDTPDNPLISRFATRIHRLDIGGPGEGAGRTIDLLAPVDPDALLDDPAVAQRYKTDNYMPYWPIIWPSGLMLASKILTDPSSPPALPLVDSPSPLFADSPPRPLADSRSPPHCLELGCGLGLAGIAAGLRGWHVTFTDYDPEAILFAAHNARRNGIPPDRIRALHMDWREPLAEQFAWIIASDVLYERRLHPLVLQAISKLLAPGGIAWIGDPLRSSAEDFPLAAVQEGFRVQTLPMKASSPGLQHTGNCYLLQRPPALRPA